MATERKPPSATGIKRHELIGKKRQLINGRKKIV